jgi:molybdate transport system substrate-binding protein
VTPRPRTARAALALIAAGLLVGGCTSAPAPSSTSSGGSAAPLAGAITVLAASSLTGTFTTLGAQFEAANPGTTVTLSFGASSGLATQIGAGAPADVFASASTATMEQVVDTGAASAPATFATNTLEIAVPPTNPGRVTSLGDLDRSDVSVAICQGQVPCGKATATLFVEAGLGVMPVTLEPDVKAVLSKVTLGEVDAGVVYVTDVLAAGSAVLGVEIPTDANVVTTYPIAALSSAPNPSVAAAFVAYVLSPEGQQVLRAAGFGSP